MFRRFFINLRHSDLGEFVRSLMPNLMINRFFHFPLALLAILYYRYPAKKLKIIGVTGTDGKTTTTTLIYEILRKAGLQTALISTISVKIGSLDFSTGFHVTSPSPWQLQKILRLIVNKGFEYLVLESSSHGLDQYRLLGCNFYAGVVTNITHDHLDYHKTWKNYLLAKAKLFRSTQFSILNRDDNSYKYLRKIANGKVVSYGLNQGDYNLHNFFFKTLLPGDYNRLNCLAAAATTKSIGIDEKIIRETIAGFKGIKGRMEEIKTEKGFKVFIDFASTPNSLKQALTTLKKLPHKKIIAVFGCAGLRDIQKRPLMGKAACCLADKVILTAEDPRTENVNKIINQIARGCQSKNKVIIEIDRQKAIDLAINKLAKKGDIIGIFGKGHEQSMCFGNKEYPWSEEAAVKKALNQKVEEKINEC